ncbi:MAG: hypothetical protein WCA29_15090 [Jiangellales bacterium]
MPLAAEPRQGLVVVRAGQRQVDLHTPRGVAGEQRQEVTPGAKYAV